MSRLRSRVERLERYNPDPHAKTVEIWEQATDGADRYTCAKRPGEQRAAADFGDEPATGAGMRVYLLNMAKPAAGPW